MNDTTKSGDVTDITENPGLLVLQQRVRDHWEELSRAERSVAQLLVRTTAERLLYAGAQDLGAESRTSNATVVRTIQSLGYSGLSELKQQVAAPFSAAVSPEIRARQRIKSIGGNIEEVWRSVNTEASERLELAFAESSIEPMTRAVHLALAAPRVITYGVGASGLAAEHLALKLNRIGLPSHFISASGFQLADQLLMISAEDAVMVFAPGRMLADLRVLLQRARDVGAKVVLISDELQEELSGEVEVCLHAPHTPTGLTAEALTSLLVADVLVQTISAMEQTRTVQTKHELTVLRHALAH
ncbi:transcriptional regulator [Arthrobacter sp. MYb211]|nr:transcriptional regulator [Arthrobacter sp. MYb221]PRC10451.1 transcriptional regulator [Arthrobacter sp. MYb211]